MEPIDNAFDLMDDDGYPEFIDVINGLKQQEDEDNQAEMAGDQADEQKDTLNPEALEGMLGVFFTMAEQVTSALSGVEFAFDAKGKHEVIKAASPVLVKHGGQLLGVFGAYVEEATLVIAVITLVYTSKRHLTELKIQKFEQEKRDAEAEKARPKAA